MQEKQPYPRTINRYFCFITYVFFCSIYSSFSFSDTVKVGVLATRGSIETHYRWQPTLDWLSKKIPNKSFILSPLTLSQMEDAVKKQRVDYIITNPGQAVQLGRQLPLSWLATLNSRNGNATSGSNYTTGSALVVRQNSAYHSIKSLSGHPLVIVNKNAFGGYLTMRFEVKKRGLNESHYFSNTRELGYPLDALIYQLRDNHIEGAIVPVCLLETMITEGLVDKSKFRVINDIAPRGFACATSTSLYPNWSFAKIGLDGAPLTKKITKALLSLPSDNKAAVTTNALGWTPPVSQLSVDKLYQNLAMHPLQKPWWQEAILWVQQNQQWGWMIFVFIITLTAYHFLLEYRFNCSKQKLEHTLHSLKEKNSMLEHAQRVAIVGELGSSLAHEINQPLATIQHYNHGILLRIKKGEPIHTLIPFLEKIEQQVMRADQIIQRLRKLIDKRITPKSDCDMNDLIFDTLSILDYDIKNKGIEITLQHQYERNTVWGDPVGLQQLLLNLINNATEACLQSNQSSHQVNITTQHIAQNLIITIKDNGMGLENDDPLLSKPFLTTKKNGLGLGLAICRNVIEEHNGSLSLTSSHPAGCEATITLPLTIDSSRKEKDA
jgi:two-component system sensor histidine kinase TtrS